MKKRVQAMLLCIILVLSLLPTAALAADDQMQTAQQLSADAVQAVADKTAAAEALKAEMESFRSEMEAKLKTPGEAKLEELNANIALIVDKWEDVSAESGTDYEYNLAENTLTVNTAAGLAWMAQQVNAGSLAGTAVTLADDIDLSGKLWTPVQDFTGTFDGQEHTITGLTINNEAFETEAKFVFLGLFQNIEGTEDARSFVKNVTFENVSVNAPKFNNGTSDCYPSFGTVVGHSDYTDYENITVTGELTICADGDAAGIVYDSARDSSRGNSIQNCKIENVAVYANEDFYGMTYNAYNAPQISDCSVSGTFYVGDEFAGIAYYAEYGAVIQDCTVSGKVYSGNDIYGIAYEVYENEYDEGDGNGQNVIDSCVVELNACSEDDLFGLVYSVEDDSVISNCSVSGTYYSGYYFYGLGEYLDDGGTVKNCTVDGKVYAYGTSAGAIGEASSASDESGRAAVITEVDVNLTAYYDGSAGGLIYQSYGEVNISDCTVTGEIYSAADEDFGGIVTNADNYTYTDYTQKIYSTAGRHQNNTNGLYCDTTDHKANSTSYHTGRYYKYAQVSHGALKIENCQVSAPIWRGVNASSNNGGIIGDASVDTLVLTGCDFTGGFYMAPDSSFYIGGLIGDATGEEITAKNCNVTCDVIVCAEAVDGTFGGLVGESRSNACLEGCHFTGNLIVNAAEDLDLDYLGGMFGYLDTDYAEIANCTLTGQIVVDGHTAATSNSVRHLSAQVGYSDLYEKSFFTNCSFTVDVSVLGNAEYPTQIGNFGMLMGEDESEDIVMRSITVNGNFAGDYIEVSDGLGGGIGRHYCADLLDATNVVVNGNITVTNANDIDSIGGFIANADEGSLVLTECQYNGTISVETTTPDSTISALGGFVGNALDYGDILSKCAHNGAIIVKGATVGNVGGFMAHFNTRGDEGDNSITDCYTFGDILLEDCTLTANSSAYFSCGVGQWLGKVENEGLVMKNCYSVGDMTVNGSAPEGSYIGAVCGNIYRAFTLDNYYHAGTLTVNSADGTPGIGYLTGNAGATCDLTNVYFDNETFSASTLNGEPIELALGTAANVFSKTFVPLSTIQMQTNRYESDEAFTALDGSPAVAEPGWDYLNGETYADEIDEKAPLVDALNAGKDGYLNWRVDGDSFRGYPFFGQSYTILYYVDFGNGYELQNIEQFEKAGTTAKEIPVPDQEKYPNSAYEWQDQDGVPFTAKTRLNGDKMVYAQLVHYYTVQYITNYPDDLAITPSDHDILENNYISGATVTIRSNNTFTIPDGYRFKEWNTDADGSGTKLDAFSTQQIEDENLVFYAIWEPLPQPVYSVYYVSNGGNGDMWDASEYHSGDTVTVKANEFVHPEDLEFTGFLEYETETLYQPDDTFTISRDTYLIAQWKVPTFSVTYLPGDGGQGSMTDETAYKSGEDAVVQANQFTKEGYEFAGFADLDDNHYKGDGTESITMTKDVVLIAQWTPVKYAITYHGNGAAEDDVVDGDYLYKTPVTIRDGAYTFTKENSNFLYWSLTPDGEKAYDANETVEITEDMDLYAIWETSQPEETFSVTYKPNGASGSDVIDGGHASGTTVTAKDGSIFTRANYTFQYWSLTANGKKAYSPNDQITLTEDVVLYAIWSKNSSGGGGGGGGGSTSSTGAVSITKVDSADKQTYLSGAKFELYTSAGKLIGTYTTDENGQIKVSDLDSGKYYVVEIVSPKGYTLDSTKHEFTVSGGKTTTLTLTNTRTDVPGMLNGEDHFAYIIGRDDGLVHPEAPITRAEVTTIFFRLLDPTIRENNLSTTNAFTDVDAGSWYNTAISTMTKLKIVNGRSATTFDPNAYITRAEFAAIAARFDDSSVSQLANFSDISGHWAAAEISKAAANGWVNGYSDGTFKPDQNITRAEAMALINRVLNRAPESQSDLLSQMVKWPDNLDTNRWYYLDIQEATNSHDYTRKTNGCETWSKLTQVPDWKEYEK